MSFIEKFQKNLGLLGQTITRIPVERTGLTRRRVEELIAKHGHEIKQVMAQSQTEHVEYGAMLCIPSQVLPFQFIRGEGFVKLGCVTRGKPYQVRVGDCHNGVYPVGTIHTHWQVDVFSPEDVSLGIQKELLTCLVFSRNGTTHLRCISPWLFKEYPMRTRAWIISALNQTDLAYKKIVDLGKKYSREWELYNQGKLRFDELSSSAKAAYTEFKHYNTIINTMQPTVEKLLDAYEVEL